MKPKKIPHTDSIEDLARFWETHDLTDFDDELEDVCDPVFEHRLEEKVTIRLPAEEVEVVKRLAKSRGLGPAALLREWVLEKLQHT